MIDAEIERLQEARLLIAQSAVGKRSNRSHETPHQTATAGKQFLPRDRRSQVRRPTPIKEEPQVLVTRIPPKESPKRRVVRAAAKQLSALTGDIPQGPVVAPANNRVMAAGADNRPAASTSAFGMAIT